MLVQRLRRWTKIEPALGQRLVLAPRRQKRSIICVGRPSLMAEQYDVIGTEDWTGRVSQISLDPRWQVICIFTSEMIIGFAGVKVQLNLGEKNARCFSSRVT